MAILAPPTHFYTWRAQVDELARTCDRLRGELKMAHAESARLRRLAEVDLPAEVEREKRFYGDE